MIASWKGKLFWVIQVVSEAKIWRLIMFFFTDALRRAFLCVYYILGVFWLHTSCLLLGDLILTPNFHIKIYYNIILVIIIIKFTIILLLIIYNIKLATCGAGIKSIHPV
jgi:hypothetical protein